MSQLLQQRVKNQADRPTTPAYPRTHQAVVMNELLQVSSTQQMIPRPVLVSTMVAALPHSVPPSPDERPRQCGAPPPDG